MIVFGKLVGPFRQLPSSATKPEFIGRRTRRGYSWKKGYRKDVEKRSRERNASTVSSRFVAWKIFLRVYPLEDRPEYSEPTKSARGSKTSHEESRRRPIWRENFRQRRRSGRNRITPWISDANYKAWGNYSGELDQKRDDPFQIKENWLIGSPMWLSFSLKFSDTDLAPRIVSCNFDLCQNCRFPRLIVAKNLLENECLLFIKGEV